MSRKASAWIPAPGLPVALETLMSTLLESFELKSWNIYNDFNGSCCLKIRWRPPQNRTVPAGESQQQVQPVKYKKKSPSAQSCEFKRSSTHHSSTTQIRTRSQTASLASVESKEGCRSVDTIMDRNSLIQSPVAVQSDIPVNTSIICSPDDLDSSVNELSSVNYDLSTPENKSSNIDSSPVQISPPLLDSELASIQNNRLVDTPDSSEEQNEKDFYIQRGPVCQACSCYFHDNYTHDYTINKYKDRFKVFQCTKCPVIVCIRCFEGGGAHQEHSQYLVDISDD